MKKQWITFGAAFLVAGVTNAQQWGGSGTQTGSIYRTGNVGIGTSGPIDRLHIIGTFGNQGIQVDNTSSFASWLRLKTSGTGAGDWCVATTGSSNSEGNGQFIIHDATSSTTRFLIQRSTGNVGIGTMSPLNNNKLHVVNSNQFGVGIRGEAEVGLQGWGTHPNSGLTYGVKADGVIGIAANGWGSVFQPNAVGLRGSAFGSATNYGTYTDVNGIGSSVGYGIYAKVHTNGAPNGDYAGVFDGDVVITGSQPASAQTNPALPPAGPYALQVNGNAYTSAGTWYGSDRKIKKEIAPLENMLGKINQLKPSQYLFRSDEFKTLNLPSELQLGLIAQELEEVFPELVNEKAETTLKDIEGNEIAIPSLKVVNYTGLIPVLIAGMQEQQKQIDELKALVQQLTAAPQTGGVGSAQPRTNISGATINQKGIVLNQNAPNPFAESTTISYTLPETYGSAQLVFRANDGKTVKTVDLSGKGRSSVTVYANDLSSGTYSYSLVIDGETAESKTMIRQ